MAVAASSNQPQMDAGTFTRLCQLVDQACGITLNEDKATLVTNRLFKRLRELNLNNYSDYLTYLKADKTGEEMTTLLDSISTNVTYFFREPEHFMFLQQTFDRWIAEGKKKFRVWCAAASTGEEPYTFMMSLEDRLKSGIDLKMMATDISTRALSKAIRGEYQEKALKDIPPDLRRRFMQPAAEPGMFSVVDGMKKRITYRRLNLVEMPLPFKDGGLDLVLCRNTMIYFQQPLRQKLVNEFERLLRPGGFLVVSHSESLVGVKTELHTVKPSIYQKDE